MNESTPIFILGLIAGICSAVSFVPQIFKIWKERSAKDISAPMYAIFTTGSVLWLIYGLSTGAVPVAITNGVTLTFNIIVIYLKFRFRQSAKK